MEELKKEEGTVVPQEEVQEETPQCLRRFNAGAFVFSWIWGICNGVWLSLLCFIPVVGWLLRIMLGFSGNELAWEKQKKRRTSAKFDKRQGRWSIAGWIVLGLFGIYVFGVLMIPFLM